MIPWERQLTKPITEYTQWESDETREIKGSGPWEAFRGERLQAGSPHTHSCLEAPVLTQEQSHFCLRKPQWGKAGSKNPLIGVVNERPHELQMPLADWGTLFLSSLLCPPIDGLALSLFWASPQALSVSWLFPLLWVLSHLSASLLFHPEHPKDQCPRSSPYSPPSNASIWVPFPQNQLGDWPTNLITHL